VQIGLFPTIQVGKLEFGEKLKNPFIIDTDLNSIRELKFLGPPPYCQVKNKKSGNIHPLTFQF